MKMTKAERVEKLANNLKKEGYDDKYVLTLIKAMLNAGIFDFEEGSTKAI